MAKFPVQVAHGSAVEDKDEVGVLIATGCDLIGYGQVTDEKYTLIEKKLISKFCLLLFRKDQTNSVMNFPSLVSGHVTLTVTRLKNYL